MDKFHLRDGKECFDEEEVKKIERGIKKWEPELEDVLVENQMKQWEAKRKEGVR